MASPFSPVLHKLIKKSLASNVAVITKLRKDDPKGLPKLAFSFSSGSFSLEYGYFGRSIVNMFKGDSKNSALNQNSFEFPLLITFYEIRKLQLKIDNNKTARDDKTEYNRRLPNGAYDGVCNGLKFLKDFTYAAKSEYIEAITEIINKADLLKAATTQPQLDCHLVEWIPFILPDDLRIIIFACFQYLKSKPSFLKTESDIKEFGDFIYNSFYKTGNKQNNNFIIGNEKEKNYAKQLLVISKSFFSYTRIQRAIYSLVSPKVSCNAKEPRASLQHFIDGHAWNYNGNDWVNCNSIGFTFFHCDNWKCEITKARVYIHLKYDIEGKKACFGLNAIFYYLAHADLTLLNKIKSFKISSLKMLANYADSVVIYCSDVETARRIANDLKNPLGTLVINPLPLLVQEISQGIGIATEPESSFDNRFSSFAPYGETSYSFGTHRCGLIARGLFNAIKFLNSLPNFEICSKHVAYTFSEAGVEFMKPYRTGKLPPKSGTE